MLHCGYQLLALLRKKEVREQEEKRGGKIMGGSKEVEGESKDLELPDRQTRTNTHPPLPAARCSV